MTAPFPDAHRTSRRDLHRDQPGREGIEAELVSRLTAGIAPESARRALLRCLDGELTPRAALAQILLASGSVTALREVVDEITARADEDSRAGDSLVRDRVDALTRLFIENETACARAVERLRREAAGGGAPPEVTPVTLDSTSADGLLDEVAYYERQFDQWVRSNG